MHVVISAMRQGLKIEAIKALRMFANCGLKEAKEIVEAFQEFVPSHNGTWPHDIVTVALLEDGAELVYQGPYMDSAEQEAKYAIENGKKNVIIARVTHKSETKTVMVKV